ncbi:hypothetical protein EDC36_104207 [Tepidimonas ignava]|uniref:Uncharacterized protein n=1 Tax=Tepidimonas ignava TaxID=114249 RepID=A0A4R3LFC4_9BURK|nr:hypothetical protein EDC36_104207 [Tepidimonas ignava]TSE20292.1 hypothetical protein Tigna_01923 [Tepidimonas ignava]
MARLIASARPLRRLQEAHIEACRRMHRRDWQQVWDGVLERLQRNELIEPAPQTCPQTGLKGPRSDFVEGAGRVVAAHPKKRLAAPQNPQQEELKWEP